MDRATLRKLRNSEFGVLAKFPTQPEACWADYPEVPEMPWYLEDLDAFIFPWTASCGSDEAELERLFNRRKPIFIVNHGYEFYDPWFENMRSTNALSELVRKHKDDLAFVRYGDYAQIMHDRVHEKLGA